MGTSEMELSKLAQVRIERDLTQAKVAEYVGVDAVTVSRWERGINHPHPRQVMKLCALFGKSAKELGLDSCEAEEAEEVEEPPLSPTALAHGKESTNAFAHYFQRDIELRLQCLIYDWLHSNKPSGYYAMLQHCMNRELKDYDAMTNEPSKQNPASMDMTRRAALRHMALLPIHALGLDALGLLPSGHRKIS